MDTSCFTPKAGHVSANKKLEPGGVPCRSTLQIIQIWKRMPKIKNGSIRTVWDIALKKYIKIFDPRKVIVWSKEELLKLKEESETKKR